MTHLVVVLLLGNRRRFPSRLALLALLRTQEDDHVVSSKAFCIMLLRYNRPVSLKSARGTFLELQPLPSSSTHESSMQLRLWWSTACLLGVLHVPVAIAPFAMHTSLRPLPLPGFSAPHDCCQALSHCLQCFIEQRQPQIVFAD